MLAQVVKRRHANQMAALLLGGALLGLAACGKEEAPPQMPPAEVEVVTIQPQAVPITVELPGRVQAVRTAEVRARVDGIVERRLYMEGTDVKAGAPLFQIDPKPLQARLDAARASLRRAQAEATDARRNLERFKPLVARNAISQQEFDAAQARLAQAEADVRSAEAQVEQDRLNLGYATVTSPISGRAGQVQVTEGALVSAAQGTLMTTVEQMDPIYVNFSQSSSKLLQIRRDIDAGRLKPRELDRTRVTLILEDGTVYEHVGRLNFLGLTVDPSTGTVNLRAQFPNPKRILLPGEFARARVELGVDPNGIMVPQKAVQLSSQGGFVLVVDQKNIVSARPVKLGELIDDKWVIQDGLKPGDRVIVEGIVKARPGAPVKPVDAAAAAKTPATQAPAGGVKPAAAPAQ